MSKPRNIKRTVVKYAAHLVVANVVAASTEAAINTVTDTDDQDTKSMSQTVGGAVAIAVTTLTWRRVDNIVDKAADWRQFRKMAKAEQVAATA